MNPISRKLRSIHSSIRCFSVTSSKYNSIGCKLLVVGGGTGGCAVAARFARKLPPNEVVVLEPAENHYYQPMFTLVGAGIKEMRHTYKTMKSVLPKNAKWVKDSAIKFNPESNEVVTKNNNIIKYDYMIVATGLQLRYDLIPGLLEGLASNDTGVCSIYSPTYADNAWATLQRLQSGNAIFTFPNSPVKCPGAPQKICYLADDYYRKKGRRSDVNISYNTSLPVIFGVKKYADALWKVVKARNINVNLRTNLIEVRPTLKQAIFQNLDKPEEVTTMNYDVLHVTPPMATPASLSSSKSLTNAAGFLEVNKQTLQHVRFNNIFGIGDCTDSPNSKTAAAAAAQSPVVTQNLTAVMQKSTPSKVYDGYASCPLITSYNKCILAEFDYNLAPLETFPVNQGTERRSMFVLKKDLMPILYWQLMTKGYWNGPELMRKIMHPFS